MQGCFGPTWGSYCLVLVPPSPIAQCRRAKAHAHRSWCRAASRLSGKRTHRCGGGSQAVLGTAQLPIHALTGARALLCLVCLQLVVPAGGYTPMEHPGVLPCM